MFACDEQKSLPLSNHEYVKLAFKETNFSSDDTFTKEQMNKIIELSLSASKLDIIDSLIESIVMAERHDKSAMNFVAVFYYLAEKFSYDFYVNSKNKNLLTCYKYCSDNNFQKLSIPAPRIKYIKQHDIIPLGANTSVEYLSQSRVSCVTENDEEFIILPISHVIINLKSDILFNSITAYYSEAIKLTS